jgi:hypothetical protein
MQSAGKNVSGKEPSPALPGTFSHPADGRRQIYVLPSPVERSEMGEGGRRSGEGSFWPKAKTSTTVIPELVARNRPPPRNKVHVAQSASAIETKLFTGEAVKVQTHIHYSSKIQNCIQMGVAQMLKISERQGNKWIDSDSPAAFTRERLTSSSGRLKINLPRSATSTFHRLVETMIAPFSVLYILHKPRGEGEPGRYQSQEISGEQLDSFLRRFELFWQAMPDTTCGSSLFQPVT